MQKTFIGILLLVLAVVLFSLENSKSISVSFWVWQFESNLSLVLILSVIVGAVLSFLFSLPYRAKKNQALKSCEKKIRQLEGKVLQLEKDKAKPVNEIPEKTPKSL